jgi:hypothetical protein
MLRSPQPSTLNSWPLRLDWISSRISASCTPIFQVRRETFPDKNLLSSFHISRLEFPVKTGGGLLSIFVAYLQVEFKRAGQSMVNTNFVAHLCRGRFVEASTVEVELSILLFDSSFHICCIFTGKALYTWSNHFSRTTLVAHLRCRALAMPSTASRSANLPILHSTQDTWCYTLDLHFSTFEHIDPQPPSLGATSRKLLLYCISTRKKSLNIQ